MKLRFSKLVAGLTMAAATVAAPQALAYKDDADSKIRALQSQINQMSEMLSSMQSELARVRAESSQTDPKLRELEDWMTSVKNKPVEEKTKDNMVFFRGGFARQDHKRNGVSIYSDVAGSQLGLPGEVGDNEGWYIGAGFDFSLVDDFWGVLDKTEVLGELMVEYREFSDNTRGNVLAQNPTFLATGVMVPTREVTVSQLTLSASPKIKFMKGSNFRPWVIPIGLGLHVISPPSESITVLNPGLQFGGGVDYKVWKNLYVGADARYHLTGGSGDGINTDGFTAGGYLGIGF